MFCSFSSASRSGITRALYASTVMRTTSLSSCAVRPKYLPQRARRRGGIHIVTPCTSTLNVARIGIARCTPWIYTEPGARLSCVYTTRLSMFSVGTIQPCQKSWRRPSTKLVVRWYRNASALPLIAPLTVSGLAFVYPSTSPILSQMSATWSLMLLSASPGKDNSPTFASGFS